jgi:hypothetical protein
MDRRMDTGNFGALRKLSIQKYTSLTAKRSSELHLWIFLVIWKRVHHKRLIKRNALCMKLACVARGSMRCAFRTLLQQTKMET